MCNVVLYGIIDTDFAAAGIQILGMFFRRIDQRPTIRV